MVMTVSEYQIVEDIAVEDQREYLVPLESLESRTTQI